MRPSPRQLATTSPLTPSPFPLTPTPPPFPFPSLLNPVASVVVLKEVSAARGTHVRHWTRCHGGCVTVCKLVPPGPSSFPSPPPLPSLSVPKVKPPHLRIYQVSVKLCKVFIYLFIFSFFLAGGKNLFAPSFHIFPSSVHVIQSTTNVLLKSHYSSAIDCSHFLQPTPGNTIQAQYWLVHVFLALLDGYYGGNRSHHHHQQYALQSP